ncbi:peptidoglycan editing factor PgeF [Aquirufa rosea]|uniref:Purine nucleoside phosphorylase n=1 Tax=Aquirufa rosea TaxID=2509241 RepID=A0A4Q1C0A7_9BACT|nr:peptidoglycan editing factor PgeF [Aquirufa rosea]RXK49831.1 peptidoglycan editing factor PgeF [Aquirufa rosea]
MINHSDLFIKPEIFKNIPQLVAGVSTRHGGKSPSPYQSLNLGVHTEDHPTNIQANLLLLCQNIGIDPAHLARSFQTHQDVIWECSEPNYAQGFDAIISTTPNIFSAVGIADCCPVLLVDQNQKITAAIHAGWKGSVLCIVAKTAQLLLSKYGCQAQDILAYIGPCISLTHFEVGDEVAAQFSSSCKQLFQDKWHVDLKKHQVIQLNELGITQIEISPWCTVEHNEHFFSHRKEQGITGRMLALAGFHA